MSMTRHPQGGTELSALTNLAFTAPLEKPAPLKIATFNINNVNRRPPRLGWKRPSRTQCACRS